MSSFRRILLDLDLSSTSTITTATNASLSESSDASSFQPSPVTELAHGLISACISGTPPSTVPPASAGSCRRSFEAVCSSSSSSPDQTEETPTTLLVLGAAGAQRRYQQRCVRKLSVCSVGEPTPPLSSSATSLSSSSNHQQRQQSASSIDSGGNWRRYKSLPLRHRLLAAATDPAGGLDDNDKENAPSPSFNVQRKKLSLLTPESPALEPVGDNSGSGSITPTSVRHWRRRPLAAVQRSQSSNIVTNLSTNSVSIASPASLVSAARRSRFIAETPDVSTASLSGRSISGRSTSDEFRFAAPTSRPPRGSRSHSSSSSSSASSSGAGWASPRCSHGSVGVDGFADTSDSDSPRSVSRTSVPSGLCDLLSAPILHVPPPSCPTSCDCGESVSEQQSHGCCRICSGDCFSRSKSSSDSESTKIDCTCQLRQCVPVPGRSGQFKRSEPTCDTVVCKRHRTDSPSTAGNTVELQRSESYTPSTGCDRVLPLQRCHSESEASIKRALQRSCQDPDLISDFTRNYALPLCPESSSSKNADLRLVGVETVAALLHGEFDSTVASYQIIDCRYPYEYDGGHIRGAINLYVKDDVHRHLLGQRCQLPAPRLDETPTHKRNVLIFHCEFSSERGPSMFRFIRSQDRHINHHTYPALHYPEMYLLEGGYKKFFALFPQLCAPCSYKPMNKPGHEHDLKHFRAKSKSWAGDSKSRGFSKRIVL